MKMFIKLWKDSVVGNIISSFILIVLTAKGGAIGEKWTMDGNLSILQMQFHYGYS